MCALCGIRILMANALNINKTIPNKIIDIHRVIIRVNIKVMNFRVKKLQSKFKICFIQNYN